MTVGEQIVVTAEVFHEPRRARPRVQLRYPPVPADALRSRLSGGMFACQVDVGADGKAVADCSGNALDLPSFLLVRARKILEAAPWEPATNDLGEPCKDRVTVRFRWD